MLRDHRCILLAALIGSAAPICAAQDADCQDQSCIYLDRSHSPEERAADLVRRMTLEEKIAQTLDHSPAIPRLHVMEYNWWNEGLHGVARSGFATVFPQAIALAATWSPPLVHEVADTIATEARARYNEASRHNKFGRYSGLTYWSPNINIFRDPRWGRGQETYGEDPFLTASMGVAFVQGLQGDDPNYLKVIATPKHFAVHSGPEPGRHGFNVQPSRFDLEDTYLPAFRAAITEGKAASIMCAYNAVDNVPACASKFLLQETLRQDWHFDGFVVSDCDAVNDIAVGHHFSADVASASAVSLRAGTDLDCGSAYKGLRQAFEQKQITEADLDAAVTRLFAGRMRLGMFDPPEDVPFSRLAQKDIGTPAANKLALETAERSIVLLKNEGKALPLAPGKNILVVGPTADLLQSIEGNYNGTAASPVLPLAGMIKEFGEAHVRYAAGAPLANSAAMPVPTSYLHPRLHSSTLGLTAEYFDNPALIGSPSVVRVDRLINFDWDSVLPAPQLHNDKVSVRWTGSITFPAAGKYVLSFHGLPRPKKVDVTGEGTISSLGKQRLLRVFLDGKVIMDSASGDTAASIDVPHESEHAIRIEYLRVGNDRMVALQWTTPDAALLKEAIMKAKEADVIVAFVGLSPDLEGEQMSVKIPGFSGGDRTSIYLPSSQEQLLEAMHASGKPVVVVLQSGSAVSTSWADTNASAILEAWYGGEAAGTAIARTLSGANNPSGKLPVTFYRSVDDLPPFTDYSMAGRTYRYYAGQPLYPFGFGLSYSKFQLSSVHLSSSEVKADVDPVIEGTITNLGMRAGSETIQVYVDPASNGLGHAPRLVGFRRVDLCAGGTASFSVTINSRWLSHVAENGEHVLSAGPYALHVGTGQPRFTSDDRRLNLVVTGDLRMPR